MPFTNSVTVRFQHCDPAGIVFYPRYFEMFNLTIEKWFEEIIDVGFNKLHFENRLGIPMVRMETDFKAMSRLEDVLNFTLKVNRMGNASINCIVHAECNGETRVQADMTMVCFDLDANKPTPWPTHIRPKIETYMEAMS
jgi:4-hydroxybenzoyl-CoA thioesterase